MFGKLKQFVGMVGVTVQLELDQQFPADAYTIAGKVRLSAKQAQQITQIRVILKQHLHEGSGSERRMYEYTIGETLVLSTPFTIQPDEDKEFQ